MACFFGGRPFLSQAVDKVFPSERRGPGSTSSGSRRGLQAWSAAAWGFQHWHPERSAAPCIPGVCKRRWCKSSRTCRAHTRQPFPLQVPRPAPRPSWVCPTAWWKTIFLKRCHWFPKVTWAVNTRATGRRCRRRLVARITSHRKAGLLCGGQSPLFRRPWAVTDDVAPAGSVTTCGNESAPCVHSRLLNPRGWTAVLRRVDPEVNKGGAPHT